MKTTTTESASANDLIIGFYVAYEGEMPPFVLDTQIMPRPIVRDRPIIHKLTYEEILEYLVWEDDCSEARSVWMDRKSHELFESKYNERKRDSDRVLRGIPIGDNGIQVTLRPLAIEEME